MAYIWEYPPSPPPPGDQAHFDELLCAEIDGEGLFLCTEAPSVKNVLEVDAAKADLFLFYFINFRQSIHS